MKAKYCAGSMYDDGLDHWVRLPANCIKGQLLPLVYNSPWCYPHHLHLQSPAVRPHLSTLLQHAPSSVGPPAACPTGFDVLPHRASPSQTTLCWRWMHSSRSEGQMLLDRVSKNNPGQDGLHRLQGLWKGITKASYKRALPKT
jgi:hypothetical protein